MKKEIREIKNGIVQITTYDERWYAKPSIDEKTGLPVYKFVPSVTWIASYYPKGIGFYKWLANKGWDEAEAIKEMAGDKGSKVHQAITILLNGKEVKMGDYMMNIETGEMEELKVEEYECVMKFVEWFKETKPEILANEITAFSQDETFAGTIDIICRIDGQIYIVDIKTSQTIWPEHELQISAYSHLNLNLEELKISKEEWDKRKLAILQLGYRRNNNGWKFTEISDKFDLFLATYKIWQNECEGVEPQQKDYPLYLTLKEENTEKSKN
jgi:hypothetical protein